MGTLGLRVWLLMIDGWWESGSRPLSSENESKSHPNKVKRNLINSNEIIQMSRI
jgi:hypothetical protein